MPNYPSSGVVKHEIARVQQGSTGNRLNISYGCVLVWLNVENEPSTSKGQGGIARDWWIVSVGRPDHRLFRNSGSKNPDSLTAALAVETEGVETGT
ncbi:hypothetical protein RHMOL_Rhmol10G0208500 [Rhododendron molle]|uniref:Uncharacterized protein n=1 Tax=Rhododendron molle TaxID=49168 RepID=A0ACC0M4A6_RHOML|nr:hypothetical protein RHMOL_Rhmol10G0208500 [Rhododendron molle]